jgi:peptidoglycan/xylan/chitin deacetylase (PgdA/CDA1 family)
MKKSDFVIVTTSWDDGHKYDLIMNKLLNKYNIKGTFYATKQYLKPLDKNDLKIIDLNHEIGAHTLTHPDLISIPLETATEEIKGSKEYLEQILGHQIPMFCYPYGRYNDTIKQKIKSSGFIAARTCNCGDFSFPKDPYEWQTTLHASNGSPLMAFTIWRKNQIPIKSLFDWEIRAKMLFDHALDTGGIYHMWGHSIEFEKKSEWGKLERVLDYISNRKNVIYATNGQIFLDYFR